MKTIEEKQQLMRWWNKKLLVYLVVKQREKGERTDGIDERQETMSWSKTPQLRYDKSDILFYPTLYKMMYNNRL